MEVWFRLSHPHVLPFLGACITSATPLILTPLAPNGTARAYREVRPDANWLKIVSSRAQGKLGRSQHRASE
jgi:serine/threonine protein kinase